MTKYLTPAKVEHKSQLSNSDDRKSLKCFLSFDSNIRELYSIAASLLLFIAPKLYEPDK